MRRVVLGVLDWPKTGIRLLAPACAAGAMLGMMLLAGCTSSAKLSDLGRPSDAANTSTASADPGDTTGSIVTQPAEPGPSGEPVAPLAKPGFLGDDPHDDLQLGKKYFRNNSFGLAQKSFQSAVEKHPNDAEAWVGLAASYDRLRRFDLADRAYSQAMRLVGRTPEILNDMGFSFMLRGDYERANKTLQEAQAKEPGNPYIQANLHLLEQSYRNGKSVQ
jgi:tetratricopeptide (TPR) repeat protein